MIILSRVKIAAKIFVQRFDVVMSLSGDKRILRDLSEISRGGGGVETEGGSHLFETAEKGGVMKNGLLKGGGSCKYVSVIM